VIGSKDRADKLFSLAIVEGTGYCENPFCKTRGAVLTPAHIINRWNNRVRCDVRNAFCLCIFCHSYFEDHPLEFNKFVEDSWAFIYMPALIAKANVTLCLKMDWSERVEFLTDIVCGLKTLKQARLEEL